MMYVTKKKNFRRRAWAFFLALCLSVSLLPPLGGTADAVGETAMDQLLNWGVVGGYPDGGLHPERSLTRAEFVAMVNRAYGYTTPGPTPFIDVPANAWYYDDIGIAYNANYFGGVSPRMAAPDTPLTREQAMVLLARNMRLDPVGGEVIEFSDGRNFADWSRGYARAAAQMGMIGGYGDGSYKPQNDISRGEMAIMLQRALGTLVNKPGTHTLSDTYGNVTISSPGATLKDTTIAGNLYITGGLDLGDITLDNVRVLGDIIVAGGGESQNGESIILRNVEADSLLVDSIAEQYVSLRAEGNTEIGDTTLRSDAYVQDRTRPGQGLLNISLESPDLPAEFTLSGNLETVVNKTPGSTLNIAMGTVDSLTIDETARDTTLNLDIDSTALTLNLDTAANVVGVGDIDQLYVNSAGSVVEMLPDTITIRPGLTANIAGEDLNAVQAQESSADPRLLASYPKVRNVAPTSATAVYSANKAGTVYWAVTTTTDGSVGEEELITPTEDNTTALLSGTTDIAASSTETTEALANLTPDGNYYLTAVLVDARDRHSPVKVASFATPDNTTPAFNTGYPAVSQNRWDYVRDGSKNIVLNNDGTPKLNYHVQISYMPNKTCQLYYALYNTGSTAPTAQQFRVGALGQPLRSGIVDATKNVLDFLPFNDLDETTTYDLYLCLMDADGARSSAVQRLTFTTVDGTPPEFQYSTPEVTDITANSIQLRVNLSEDGTVYWAAVRSGIDYLKPPTTAEKIDGAIVDSDVNKDLFIAYYQRQIENGINSVSSGSQTVRANTDATVNVTGLAPETSYDIYYIAKDTAGNYSLLAVDWNGSTYVLKETAESRNMLTESTLDTNGPTATQDFSLYDTASLQPYANTDITITLSENVQRASQRGAGKNLVEVYDDGKGDKDDLAAFLSNTFKFYNTTDIGRSQLVTERNSKNEYRTDSLGNVVKDSDGNPIVNSELNWIIDYRKAIVSHSTETGEVTVTFRTADGALNLRSGATYYFQLTDLSDVSSNRNPLTGGSLTLDRFTTIAAEVALRPLNVTNLANVASNNEIDLAFSLTPTSVNVEDSVDWDMLLWSDSSVKFDVYLLKDNGNGTFDGTKITNANAQNPSNTDLYSFYQAVQNKNVNTQASDEIIITEDMSGYYGASLFRDFFAFMSFPSINKTLGTLATSGGAYYFGIRFTEVNSNPTRNSWGQTVNFRASVITGNSTYLGTLASGDISEERFEEHKSDWGVNDIGTPIPFSMRAVFTDTTAPSFSGSYPLFTPEDTNVTMQFMLNHAGTVYYVIAPASDTSTAIQTEANLYPATTTGADGSETVTYGVTDAVIYPSGYTDPDATDPNQHIKYTNGFSRASGGNKLPTAGDSDSAPFYLSSPRPSNIYNPRDYRSNTDIKTGSVAVGTGATPVTVSDLKPETTYFVYLVTRGTGSVYSQDVQLYMFKTEKMRRPILNLTLSNPIVNVRSTNMAANANYLLVRYDNTMSTLLSRKFAASESAGGADALDTGVNSTLDAAARVDWTSSAYKDLTVLEVMNRNATDGSGASLFDQFAKQTYKDLVASYIRATAANATSVIANGTLSLARDVAQSIDCSRFPMSIVTQYAFLAVAESNGSSDAFRSIYPVTLTDNDAPQVTEINYAFKPATSGSNAFSGTISLTFNEYLYSNDTSTKPPTLTPLDRGQTGERTDDTGYRSVGDLIQSRSGTEIYTPNHSTENGKNTLTIVLEVTSSNGSFITFSPMMSDQYGNTRRDGLTVTVNVNRELQPKDYDENGNPTGYASVYVPSVSISPAWQAPGMTINGVRAS